MSRYRQVRRSRTPELIHLLDVVDKVAEIPQAIPAESTVRRVT